MDAHVLLPGGYWDEDGALHRDAWLRPLTGHEEELLGNGQADPARSTTLVLSRCLLRLGALEPVPTEVVRRLVVGDREALLLRLRQLTFGDLVRADLICPWPQCGEQVSLTFQLSDLPWPEPPVRTPTHTLRLSGPDASAGPVEVTFRLPDGGDQEELSSSAVTHPAVALGELLRRCVVAVVPEGHGVVELTPRARAEIETEMERLAPQLDRVVQTRCAECDRLVLVPFDLHRCFFGELSTDAHLLYREVHQLAFHYHWGESEILAMPRPRRHTYLGVLAEELESLDRG